MAIVCEELDQKAGWEHGFLGWFGWFLVGFCMVFGWFLVGHWMVFGWILVGLWGVRYVVISVRGRIMWFVGGFPKNGALLLFSGDCMLHGVVFVQILYVFCGI